MSTKHTPGPWKAIGLYVGTAEADTQTVAYVDDHRNNKHRSRAEHEANARLIAAAPELLIALHDALYLLDSHNIEHPSIDAKIRPALHKIYDAG
jgi:hypothetical protein